MPFSISGRPSIDSAPGADLRAALAALPLLSAFAALPDFFGFGAVVAAPASLRGRRPRQGELGADRRRSQRQAADHDG